VTAVPYIQPDFSRIDAAFFSVQKGFGMPGGLGVMIVNDRCIERAKQFRDKGLSIGSFHNLPVLAEYAEKYQNPETPNVLAIYLIGRVSEYLNAYGVMKMREETETKARMLYDALSASVTLIPLVEDAAIRSNTIIIATTGLKQKDVKNDLLEKGYVVGSGYGKYKDSEIRIANFPMHTAEDAAEIAHILSSF
jgi:phosphoserine aminotransferase